MQTNLFDPGPWFSVNRVIIIQFAFKGLQKKDKRVALIKILDLNTKTDHPRFPAVIIII